MVCGVWYGCSLSVVQPFRLLLLNLWYAFNLDRIRWTSPEEGRRGTSDAEDGRRAPKKDGRTPLLLPRLRARELQGKILTSLFSHIHPFPSYFLHILTLNLDGF